MKARIFRPDESSEMLTEERCHILEIINAKEFAAMSLARARVEPGIMTALHVLRDTDEIYYVIQGEGRMEIDGMDEGRVRPGDAIVIQKGQSQRIMNTGDGDLIFLCLCSPRFTPDAYVDLETTPAE